MPVPLGVSIARRGARIRSLRRASATLPAGLAHSRRGERDTRDGRVTVLASAPGRLSASPWSQELRGALNATAATLPFVLSYGFIAFGALGQPAAQAGLSAAVTSFVLGGLLMVAVSRLALPSASPSASSCLIVASGVGALSHDLALQPAAARDLTGLLALVGLSVTMAGALQIAMGLLRAGRLVRLVPQPVLAGFMNGVAVLIALSQLAPALGVDSAQLARQGAAALAGWQPSALGAAAATCLVVWGTRRLWPRLPATLIALVLATVAVQALQAVLGAQWPPLQRIGLLEAAWPPPLALAPLASDAGASLLQRHGGSVLATALLLALVGSLESVLNLAVIDQQTRHRSDPDRALVSLGLVNMALGACGALPVVYLRLRALATLVAGGRSARAMVVGSMMMAGVFTMGLPMLAMCPKPVVAGVVIMLAGTLIDPWTLDLLRRRAPALVDPGDAVGSGAGDRHLSLAVIAAVGLVTVLWGFVAAVALGLLLSFVLLVRALQRSLIRQRHTAAEIPSRRIYALSHRLQLATARPGILVLELEGALFFGNVERLEDEVQAMSRGSVLRSLVLDLRRISTVDASGAVMLMRLRDVLQARGQQLLLAGVTASSRHGQSLRAHGVIGAGGDDAWALHADADHATEAAELAALAAAGLPLTGAPVELARCELFMGLDETEVAQVATLLNPRELAAGERLFVQDEPGDALYVLSAGSVSIIDPQRRQRFVSFSPGMTFGELALLDGAGRTADAIADEPSTVHALDAAAIAQLEQQAPALAARLFRNLSRHLAARLRDASAAWRRAAG